MVSKQNNNPKTTKPDKTAYVNTMNDNYTPPTLGQSLHEIFSITGTNTNFSELAKPKQSKRLFQDEKGTFMEQEKKQKGKKTIAE